MTRGHTDVRRYYDQQVGLAQASGAGLIWFMGRDQLSPPLLNADEYALYASRWPEACQQRVAELTRRLKVDASSLVLDLGCGIGGPGRVVAAESGAQVLGLSLSGEQLRNLRRLSVACASAYLAVYESDMQHLPFAANSVDGVFSVNAVYHVNAPELVMAEAYRVLRQGGRLVVDDWFVTLRATVSQLEQLRYNWSTGSLGFHELNRFCATMVAQGFVLTEVADYTDQAGAFLSEERFGTTYDGQVAPVLREVFPLLYRYEGYEPAHADLAVAQLRDNILYMGELYRTGAAVYCQIVAEK